MIRLWRRVLVIILGLTLISVSLDFGDGFNELQYTLHASIEITADEDLHVFEGSGTYEDPYLIESLNITTSNSYLLFLFFPPIR